MSDIYYRTLIIYQLSFDVSQTEHIFKKLREIDKMNYEKKNK